MPSYSGVWTLTAQYQAVGGGYWPVNGPFTRGLFSGPGNVIQYLSIGTTGNSIDFGDLTAAR